MTMNERVARRIKAIEMNDRVAYSVNFLRSVGCYSGAMANGRGKVVGFEPLGETMLAQIQWDPQYQNLPDRVNVHNLAHVTVSREFSAT